MSKILIVGAASGLAGALVERLSAGNHTVDGVIRNTSPTDPSKYRAVFESLEEVTEDHETVFLVGAYIPESMSNPDYKRLFHDNVNLVRQVVERFGESRIVLASSVAAIGPTDDYGISKAIGERLIRSHPDWAIVQLSSIYGSGMKRDNFISRAVCQALEHGQITLYGKGERRQDYMHYRDATTMLLRAGEASTNRTFLGAYGQSFTNLEIAESIRAELPGTGFRHVDQEEGDSSTYDSAESWEALEIRPSIDPRQGIRELIREWLERKA